MGNFKIYTKTGDKGMTSLVDGTRVKKNSLRIESYGTVDELNAQLGLLASFVTDEATLKILSSIQNELFTLGCNLAMGDNPKRNLEESIVSDEVIKVIENEIDRLQGIVPPLRAFVLPAGSHAASVAHVARTVCRRAERNIISLDEVSPVDANVMAYVNRLSDYLFVLSRYLNFIDKVEEKTWQKTCK